MTGRPADGYYQHSAKIPRPRPALDGDRRTDIAIIGAGYTGLSAALHLAERGFRPLVVEAESIAFGASGRNGGQVSSGQRRPQDEIECRYGQVAAQALWQLSQEAKEMVKQLVDQHRIDCDLKPGVIEAAHNDSNAAELQRYPDYLAKHYDYEHQTFVSGDAFRNLLNSPAYKSGIFDSDAAHLHPLKFAHGLADAAEAAGASIVEQTRIDRIASGSPNRLVTSKGDITADHVILACNGYIGTLDRSIASRVMPLNNFIIATEPLGADAYGLIPSDAAVADTRHVINYFRLSADGRLLFGGGETYGFTFPDNIADFVRPHMTSVFPTLADAKIDFAWGGTLAITRPRLPLFCRPNPNVWSASGYSGHGVSIGVLAGRLLAEAIAGNPERFNIMAKIAPKPFPGGIHFRLPLLWLAMLWFKLKDRL